MIPSVFIKAAFEAVYVIHLYATLMWCFILKQMVNPVAKQGEKWEELVRSHKYLKTSKWKMFDTELMLFLPWLFSQ